MNLFGDAFQGEDEMQPVKERSKKNLYDATYYFSLDFPISLQVDLKKSGSKEKDDGGKEQKNRAAVQQENEEDGGEGDEDEAANEAEENAN